MGLIRPLRASREIREPKKEGPYRGLEGVIRPCQGAQEELGRGKGPYKALTGLIEALWAL